MDSYTGDLWSRNNKFNQQQGDLRAYRFASSYSFASKYNLANKNPLTGFCGKKTWRMHMININLIKFILLVMLAIWHM